MKKIKFIQRNNKRLKKQSCFDRQHIKSTKIDSPRSKEEKKIAQKIYPKILNIKYLRDKGFISYSQKFQAVSNFRQYDQRPINN